MTKLSIYLHIPFCTVKCSYCAFNVYTHLEHLIPAFVDALCEEIRILGATNPGHEVYTIYFGGGTPTKLSVKQYTRILQHIRTHFPVVPSVEISTEANPDDLADIDYVRGLRETGLSRLSIGIQSTHEQHLSLFGRLHTQPMITKAVANAKQAGFDNINLDLIYGIPNQTLDMWRNTLTDVIQLAPQHFSLYALGIEPKTALEYWVQNGKVAKPDDDLSADMYDMATDRLAEAGYQQYEISNWAKPGLESLHNKQYWYNEPYLGIGPGAHGYANKTRTINERSPHRYITALEKPHTLLPYPQTPATSKIETISQQDEISETIMMGLRLLEEGISLERFRMRFQFDLLEWRPDVIQYYLNHGMLQLTDKHLRLTTTGRFVSNRILRDLV